MNIKKVLRSRDSIELSWLNSPLVNKEGKKLSQKLIGIKFILVYKGPHTSSTC